MKDSNQVNNKNSSAIELTILLNRLDQEIKCFEQELSKKLSFLDQKISYLLPQIERSFLQQILATTSYNLTKLEHSRLLEAKMSCDSKIKLPLRY